MEEVDNSHPQTRHQSTVVRAPQTPRELPPAGPKRTADPCEGDAYDALLDCDSDIFEYHRKKRGSGASKPIQFVYAGKFSSLSYEEKERQWELGMAERRRRASAEGPLVCNDTRPRFAGLGSVKEFQPYRQATSPANESSSSA